MLIINWPEVFRKGRFNPSKREGPAGEAALGPSPLPADVFRAQINGRAFLDLASTLMYMYFHTPP